MANMTKSDIMYKIVNMKIIELDHNCKTELGITDEEKFSICQIIGDYEQLEIVNQYGQTKIINPNQIVE